jgi:hypothetical protein
MQDGAHNDLGFDPYWPRGAIPICAEDVQGTLLARLISRVKYFENRRVNIYHGYVDQPLCEFIKESYLIDKVDPGSGDGKVCFNLKDPLILADDKNAQCPSGEDKLIAVQDVGNEYASPFRLGAQLDGLNDRNSDVVARPYARIGEKLLAANYVVGDPTQDACFTRLQHVCVGDEVLKVHAVRDTTLFPPGWNIILDERGACGTEVSEHEVSTKFTLAETFAKQHVADVILRMLLSCTELGDVAVNCCEDDPLSLIDYESFSAYRCEAPLDYVSAIICKPVGVTTLLQELAEQLLLSLYVATDTGKVTLRKYTPPECGFLAPTFSECQHMVKGSFTRKVTGDRYNQINYLHSPINCTKGLNEDNLADQTITIGADALREACDRREYKTRATKTIKSRWIDRCNAYVASSNGERWLRLRNCVPEQISFDTNFDFGKCINVGEFAFIEHARLQGPDGGPDGKLWMLKASQNNGDCTKLIFDSTPFDAMVAPCYECDAANECVSVIVEPDECGDYSDCIGVW